MRRQLLAWRRSLPPAQRRAWDRAMVRRLLAWPPFLQAHLVMGYVAWRGEPDLGAALRWRRRQGGAVVLPATDPAAHRILPRRFLSGMRLRRGPLGIPEPPEEAPAVDPSEIDLVLLPGVAFDRRGFRLGYGGGYFDRWLARPGMHARTVGVAYAAQIVESLPHAPWDRRVEELLSEEAGPERCAGPGRAPGRR
ncbi:MAG: 5-formyltetrahydrofolate cyclo-ligase [Bacillota bacterium]|nr:5-formyltetrahydrofolate cyclo-ligase [Bacillota bacterium]